ncbi:hypothetical protein CHS0354_006934 [Potamilus streckersoni]|uniref:Tetratricopeptide repeat protein n=1 Tax=Potamilus streckersoni TaxID=2493646 RepID=A0AAE0WB79_9BIVA|nr:hypothetical protein CHS0354_006934 [Potamilus streckersoni]
MLFFRRAVSYRHSIKHTLSCLLYAGAVVVSTTVLLPLSAQNAQPVPQNETDLIGYADFLFQEKEYYRAVTAYKSYLYYYSGGQYTDHAYIQVGRSYMSGDRLQDAVDYWQNADTGITLKPDSQKRVQIYLTLSYLDLEREKPYSNGGDLRMDQNDFSQRDFHTFAERFNAGQAQIQDKYKSPWLAGGLSAVLPGAGSAYNGRYIEAAYVFVLTSVFLYATFDSERRGEKGYVPVFAFFTIAFYGGGIYAAVNSTHRYNDRLHTDFLDEQRRRYRIFYDAR